jgi:hypothetical protein
MRKTAPGAVKYFLEVIRIMENPWKDLVHDENGYYARLDKNVILALRDKLKSNNIYELHLECKAPSACTGDINAPSIC